MVTKISRLFLWFKPWTVLLEEIVEGQHETSQTYEDGSVTKLHMLDSYLANLKLVIIFTM